MARTYRDLTDAEGQFRSDVSVSERDARITAQVLHVVMRDWIPVASPKTNSYDSISWLDRRYGCNTNCPSRRGQKVP
ncbi:MAG: hypothetical protein DMF96_20045 [Acidobacteria bacterium]|nr:MAG: hypothetical protein DMF96_20045 [Acidobacteriota bacterium]